MKQYRSIKEIIDAFFPDMQYKQASGENLRLSRCPFCGGKKAFINPNPSVNGFKCYSGRCGKQTGFMKLFHELSGEWDAKYTDIVAFLDNSSPRQGQKSYSQVLPKVHECQRASLIERHNVYKRLLELLVLDENDEKGLMKRGLTRQQIKRLGYKSCPKKEQVSEIVNTLEKEGFSLVGIPGFFKRYGKYTMMLADGFFVPFHSSKGYIQGLQIRRNGDENTEIKKEVFKNSGMVDYTIRVKNNNPYPINLRVFDYFPVNTTIFPKKSESYHIHEERGEIRWEEYFLAGEEKTFSYSLKMDISIQTQPKVVVQPRYMWFTSGSKDFGTSCMNYTHFVGKIHEVMYLTEGALKADVAYCLCGGKKSFVAIAGVSSLRDVPKIFKYFKENGVKEIRIVLDMDRIYNPVVMQSIEKIRAMALDKGLLVHIPEWDIRMGKGIDDFILQYLIQNKNFNYNLYID